MSGKLTQNYNQNKLTLISGFNFSTMLDGPCIMQFECLDVYMHVC